MIGKWIKLFAKFVLSRGSSPQKQTQKQDQEGKNPYKTISFKIIVPDQILDDQVEQNHVQNCAEFCFGWSRCSSLDPLIP